MALFNFDKLKAAVEGYIKVRLELFKLDMANHLSRVIAQLAAYFVMLLFLGIVITFLSIAAAFYLNEVLASSALGFVLVAAFYALLLLIILMLLKSGKLERYLEDTLKAKVSEKAPVEEE
jgi:hypothetical protein